MLDSSHAIIPDDEAIEEPKHIMGNILSYEWKNNILQFELSIEKAYLYFLYDNTLRFFASQKGELDYDESIAVVQKTIAKSGKVTENNNAIIVDYGSYIVEIGKNPFNIKVQDMKKTVLLASSSMFLSYTKTNKVTCEFEKEKDSPVYALGENAGFLNKNGEVISNWNSDVFSPHNKDTVELYQSIPLAIIHNRNQSVGIFFDNSYRTTFDTQKNQDKILLSADNGPINLYIMFGRDLKEVVKSYTHLTGTTPLPPKWALGYHQSRYSYKSEKEVLNIIDQFEQFNIPLDCIHFDIHYMDGYRVFTHDIDKFPNFEKVIANLKNKGVHVVPIVDPGVKKDHNYSTYMEGIENNYFCKYLNGDVYYGDVWPGKSAFPDFLNTDVQNWWGNLHEYYTKLGIEGIWNDMNEPAVFNDAKTMDLSVHHNKDGQLISHEKAHNLYGLYMSKATYEGLKRQTNKRPFSLTRAGYAGVQRYSAVWTGDNRSFWEHLEMSMPMIMNLGLSGVAFTGADVGGFTSDTTPELLIRWTQLGSLMPYFRNHSVQGSIHQEPWAFDEETRNHVKRYIELRYEFLPYIYTLFKESESSGLPIVRPLVMEYPDDHHTFNCSDQFLLGKSVMVSPIIRPGQTCRSVYFPKGNWIDFWTGEKYSGNNYHLIEAGIEKLPIFVLSGMILPLGSIVKNTKEKQNISLYGFGSGDLVGELYLDDGESYQYQDREYCLARFQYRNNQLNTEYTGDYLAELPFEITKIVGSD